LSVVATTGMASFFDGTLTSIIPTIAQQFAMGGMELLGESMGLDPRLTNLLSIPVSAAVGGMVGGYLDPNGGGGAGGEIVAGYRDNGEPIYVTGARNLMDYISESVFNPASMSGIISMGTSLGLDAIGAPVMLQNFLPNLLGQIAVSSGLGSDIESTGQGIFDRIWDNIEKFGSGLISAGAGLVSLGGKVVEFGAKALGTAGQITANGFKDAINAFSSIFSRETQENIYQDVAGLRQGTVTTNGDIWTWQSGDSRVDYNVATGRVDESFGIGGTARIEGLGQNESGQYSYRQITYKNAMENGVLTQTYENGSLTEWGLIYPDGTSVVSRANGLNGWGSNGTVWNGDIEVRSPPVVIAGAGPDEEPQTYTPYTYTIPVSNGQAQQANVQFTTAPGNGSTSSQPANPDKPLYVLVNGILNEESKSAPGYLLNLRSDLILRTQNKIGANDIILAPTFFASPALQCLGFLFDRLSPTLTGPLGVVASYVVGDLVENILQGSRDVAAWLSEVADPVKSAQLATEIRQSIDWYFSVNGQDERSRDIVAVGYSGGFMPVVETLLNNPYNPNTQTGYKAQSLVALGAATMQLDTASRELATKIVEAADMILKGNTALSTLQNALESLQAFTSPVVQFGAETIQDILNFVATKPSEEAYQHYLEKVKIFESVFKGFAPASLIGSGVNIVANVYGSKDILTQLGVNGVTVGGYRTELGGYRVGNEERPLINVEIVGATHFDYMRRDDLLSNIMGTINPAEKQWNERVSAFVTDLAANAGDKDKLNAFLWQKKDEQKAEFDGTKWIIKLDGWKERDPNYGQGN